MGENVAEAIVKEHGRIDLLGNSAGVNVPKRSWEDGTLASWDQLVDINLNGVMYCMRAVLPTMRAQKDGTIINVASWAGRERAAGGWTVTADGGVGLGGAGEAIAALATALVEKIEP